MTKIIGLTGGIGSGKSTLAEYIRLRGIPVYIADEEAKKLLNDPAIQQKIKEIFGETILENNQLSREKLAKIVFTDEKKLQALNAIIHPEVKKHFSNWLKGHLKAPLVVKEAAILFESGSDKDCDVIISVVAPVEVRIERVMNRDQVTRQQVLDRMSKQWTDAMRVEKSDFLVENIKLSEAKAKIDEILKKIVNQ